jgi:hypothetical protein
MESPQLRIIVLYNKQCSNLHYFCGAKPILTIHLRFMPMNRASDQMSRVHGIGDMLENE